MTPEEIKKTVIEALTRIAPEIDPAAIESGASLRDQLDLDSMDFLDIVMELRKRHRIQIPEDDYINLASMNSTVAYLEPLMKDMQRQKV
jgi:acyl carrier protein